MLNPMMNAAEFSITFRRSWLLFDFNSSTPAPEISDTYPGTKGNTHGERKEINPATKAAIGKGRLVIVVYFTRPLANCGLM
jgi:hypothetical protein